MATHVKLSKRERAAQLPFAGRVHKWRRVWVAAKATKINVRLIKWVKTGVLVCVAAPLPPLLQCFPPRAQCSAARPRHLSCSMLVLRCLTACLFATVELATEASGLRNPEVEVIKAPDARPPLPKIHRKVAEPVQPRQRSTRVRVSLWQIVASARHVYSSCSVAGLGRQPRRSGITHFGIRECRQTFRPG